MRPSHISRLDRPAALAIATPLAAAPLAHEGTSACRTLCYGFVWLMLATSSLVLVEPAPVDALACGLVLLLPMVGLVRISPALMSYLALWLIVAAAQLVAATQSVEIVRSTAHTLISLQLAVVSCVIAAFIADAPVRHMRIVLSGWVVAALVAALAAVIGYFDLLPGAAELFTRHARASGTFKDPNVIGAFLVLPLLYLIDLAVARGPRIALTALAAAGLLAFALLLTFSRGAWLSLVIALLIWGVLTLAALSPPRRLRLLLVAMAGIVAIGTLLAAALQLEEVARLIELRASLDQSYDHGPDGRFGGQWKALALIAEHPLGIGSLGFVPLHHHEEAHNVYLSMGLYAGWVGGSVYLLLVVLTVALGCARLSNAGRMRPYLVIALASFLATALEGLIIDSDHWRHFYIQMALLWGLATARQVEVGDGLSVRPATSGANGSA